MPEADTGSPGTNRRGALVIVAGPSGCGKTTLVRRLCRKKPECTLSVSATTRPRRAGEKHGGDYYFVSDEEFERTRRDGDLLEWSRHFGNKYGTPRRPVEAALQRGELVLLEIDVVGARQVKTEMPEAFVIFIAAPSEAELMRRLRGRGTEDENRVRERLERARMETQIARDGLADREIVNDNLDEATDRLVHLIEEKEKQTHAGRHAP